VKYLITKNDPSPTGGFMGDLSARENMITKVLFCGNWLPAL
jgi:hypothetical protein